MGSHQACSMLARQRGAGCIGALLPCTACNWKRGSLHGKGSCPLVVLCMYVRAPHVVHGGTVVCRASRLYSRGRQAGRGGCCGPPLPHCRPALRAMCVSEAMLAARELGPCGGGGEAYARY